MPAARRSSGGLLVHRNRLLPRGHRDAHEGLLDEFGDWNAVYLSSHFGRWEKRFPKKVEKLLATGSLGRLLCNDQRNYPLDDCINAQELSLPLFSREAD